MAAMFGNAEAYEKFMGRWSARLTRPFLDFVRVGDGARILDVGCGTGSMVAAIAAGHATARVVGLDPVEAFIGYCRARFPEARFSFDRGSAFELPYPDHAFDHVLSLLVLMLIPDPARAASEMRRVTKPGGVVASCTWDGAGMEMSAVVWDEARRLDPLAERTAERPKHCNSRGQLAALWHETGLRDVEETMIEIRTEFESFDDFWVPYLAGVGPAGSYVAGLPRDQRDALASALRTRLLGDRADGPISLGARAWAVRGTVPAARG